MAAWLFLVFLVLAGSVCAQTPSGSAVMQGAEAAQAVPGHGTVRVSPGLYRLGENVYTDGSVAWLFERGVELSGPGQIDAVADEAVLNASGLTLARLFAAPGNEFGLFVSARAAPTQGGAPYEKAGFIASMIGNDASDYRRPVLRDLVGFESQGVIEAPNRTGRIWGFNAGVGPGRGADGYAVGGEFGVQSFSGADAGPLGTPTSKIGVHAVAYGDSSSTAAFVISGNGTTWQDGFVAQTEAIGRGGHAVSVRPAGTAREADVAWIGADGSLGASGQSEVRAGALGASRQVLLSGRLDGPGAVELTSDGASGAADTLGPGPDSALLIKRLRVVVRAPASGWVAAYAMGDVLVSHGAGPELVMQPAQPVVAPVGQGSAAPGAITVSLAVDGGRLAVVVRWNGGGALHAVAEIDTLEVR